MITSIATNLRTYMGSSAVLLMSVSIAPPAIAGVWTAPNKVDWIYSFTSTGGIVTVQSFNCTDNVDKGYYATDIAFSQKICPSVKMGPDRTAIFSCLGGHTVTVRPVARTFSDYHGLVGAGHEKGRPCSPTIPEYTIEGSDLTQTGLYFHSYSSFGEGLPQIITPEQLAKCSGSLQSTSLAWEGLKVGDNIPRKTIPFVYKCQSGGGTISIDVTETVENSDAPKLQYDFGGNVITSSYELSCSSSCEKSIDFGVKGKSVATAAGNFKYSLLVSTYQK